MEVPKENMHYTCIASITTYSVMKMDKNIICRFIQKSVNKGYRVKKIQMAIFISSKLESDSESDSEAESNSDTKLIAKLKFGSDSE